MIYVSQCSFTVSCMWRFYVWRTTKKCMFCCRNMLFAQTMSFIHRFYSQFNDQHAWKQNRKQMDLFNWLKNPKLIKQQIQFLTIVSIFNQHSNNNNNEKTTFIDPLFSNFSFFLWTERPVSQTKLFAHCDEKSFFQKCQSQFKFAVNQCNEKKQHNNNKFSSISFIFFIRFFVAFTRHEKKN